VRDLAVLAADAEQLLPAERLLVEGDRLGGAVDVDVGYDGVAITIGTLVYGGSPV
jgi:hypothetical protein